VGAETATGTVTDAAAGASVVAEVSIDDAVSGTGDILGANFTLEIPFLLFSLVTSGMAIKLANMNFAVSGTGGVVGTNSSSLLVSFVFLDMTVAAATGAAADAATVALVRF
jgi:hypothetical protein